MTQQRVVGYTDEDEEIWEDLPELRCCIRCGGDAQWSEEDTDTWILVCNHCGNYYDIEWFGDFSDLADWWNKRPYVDSLLEEMARMQRMLEGVPAYMA